ncbi:MAG TPA: hypothetical protein VFQ85_09315 [Mycobacteriales bacterium]|jgi:hypothetical protein|nr:hypothetical protein [Mycobacteriales bacterium]
MDAELTGVALGFAAERAWQLAELLRRRASPDSDWHASAVETVRLLEPELLSDTELERLDRALNGGELAALIESPECGPAEFLQSISEYVLETASPGRAESTLNALWVALASQMSSAETVAFFTTVRVERGILALHEVVSRLVALPGDLVRERSEFAAALTEAVASIASVSPLTPLLVPLPNTVTAAAFLLPRFAAVPFVGRDVEMADLLAWAQQRSSPLAMVVGPPGQGKTRLAVEAGLLLQEEGWIAGLLASAAGRDALASLLSARRPVCVVVDDFERNLVAVQLLLELAFTLQPVAPLKILLLSRHGRAEAVSMLNGFAEGAAAVADATQVDLGAVPLSRQTLRELSSVAKRAAEEVGLGSRTPRRAPDQVASALDACLSALTASEDRSRRLREISEDEFRVLANSAAEDRIDLPRHTLRQLLVAAICAPSLLEVSAVELLSAWGINNQAVAEAVRSWARRERQRSALFLVDSVADQFCRDVIRDEVTQIAKWWHLLTWLHVPHTCIRLAQVLEDDVSLQGDVGAVLEPHLSRDFDALLRGDTEDGRDDDLARLALGLLLRELPDVDLGDPFEWSAESSSASYLVAVALSNEYNRTRTPGTASGLRTFDLLRGIAVHSAQAGQPENALIAAEPAFALSEALFKDPANEDFAELFLQSALVLSRCLRSLGRILEAAGFLVDSVAQVLERFDASSLRDWLRENETTASVSNTCYVLHELSLLYLELGLDDRANEVQAELFELQLDLAQKEDWYAQASTKLALASYVDHHLAVGLAESAVAAVRDFGSASARDRTLLVDALHRLSILHGSRSDLDSAKRESAEALEVAKQLWSVEVADHAGKLGMLAMTAGLVYASGAEPAKAIECFRYAADTCSPFSSATCGEIVLNAAIRLSVMYNDLDELGLSLDHARQALTYLLDQILSGDDSRIGEVHVLTLAYLHAVITPAQATMRHWRVDISMVDQLVLSRLETLDLDRFGTRGMALAHLVRSAARAVLNVEDASGRVRHMNDLAREVAKANGDPVMSPSIFNPGPGDRAFADMIRD